MTSGRRSRGESIRGLSSRLAILGAVVAVVAIGAGVASATTFGGPGGSGLAQVEGNDGGSGSWLASDSGQDSGGLWGQGDSGGSGWFGGSDDANGGEGWWERPDGPETETETATEAPTPTPTDAPTPTDTATPTDTETASPTDTETATPGETDTESPTQTETETQTDTPTPTESPTDTETATSTETPSQTPTPTDTPTQTETATPTETQTATETRTPEPTDTETATPAPTATPTPTETDTPTASPSPTNPPTGDTYRERVERAVHEGINDARAENGLGPLAYDQGLREIARYHSTDMAENGYFAHTSPGGESLRDRYLDFDYDCRVPTDGNRYKTGAENIFWYQAGTQPDVSVVADETVASWMGSSGHRQNVLDADYEHQGIGVAIRDDGTIYVTQNFC